MAKEHVQPGEKLTARKWNKMVDAVAGANAPGPNTVFVPGVGWVHRAAPAQQGQAFPVETFRITAMRDENHGFKARRINGAGAMHGPELDIYCWGADGLKVDLTNAIPPYTVGGNIRAQWQVVYRVTDGGWVAGYWAVDTFTEYGCEVTT